MKCRVVRASLWDNGSPCPGAILEQINGVYMWTITFQDLDALMAFIRDNGKCVLFNSDPDRLPTLEIYDAYRE